MRTIDRLLNSITMYRLVLYALGIYSAGGVLLALLGKGSASPTSLVLSLGILMGAAYVVDRGFGRWFNVPTNMESALISSLILFLILQPAHTVVDGLVLALIGGISSVSKFLIAWNGRHVFNPAALAAAIASLAGLEATTWWVGSSLFWPLTLLLGLAIVRKIRRFPLVITFVGVSLVVQAILILHSGQPFQVAMKQSIISSPLIFLSTIMLTEPATMPPRRNLQVAFGALVAVLYVTAWQIGPLVIYPEVALLLGNIFAFAVSPRFRVRLQLAEVRQISSRVYEYVFRPDKRFGFLPGQYMEWTLPDVEYDGRGNRRTFTIASSPTEDEIHLGVKYYEPASKFKAALSLMKPGDVIFGSQLAGNFTLKGNEGQKLAFIAGGIGITPFRSMIKYLTDMNISSDIILLYVVRDPHEFAYTDELGQAARIGVKTVPIVTDTSFSSPRVVTGQVDTELLRQLVPDHSERTFFVSGPNAMVDEVKHELYALDVVGTRIKTDHFSGY